MYEESLYSFLRENFIDILINGHTHEQKIVEIDGKYLINPGSATGVFGPNRLYVLIYFVLKSIKIILFLN